MRKPPTWALVSLGLIAFTLVLFRVVWPEGVVIQSIDYNYGLMAMYQSELPEAFFDGFWRGFPLLGRVGSTPPTLTNLLLVALPIEVYMDWIYPILLLTASGFLIGFLRLKKLAWLPCLAGTFSAFWIGSNLTLILPGHLLKYGVLACASATLFCLEKLHLTRSWRWAVLSGGTLGWMFMHQADLALFFGLLLGAYHLFRSSLAVSERQLGQAEATKKNLPVFGSLTLLVLLTAGLMVWESYDRQMETQVRNVEVLQEGSDEEKWNFATQWSFPPAESMDLIAPGFWGWTSQHETAPYHGVTGQSASWPLSQQGLPNLRMESVYVGVIALGLAGMALFSRAGEKKDIWFWSAALLLTLLLSFGKFTPFYRIFFQLPLVNVIRNPNKFLQVFQLCLGISAAFGLQGLLDGFPGKKRWIIAAGFLMVSLALGAGSLWVNPSAPDQVASFADTLWATRAFTLLQTRQVALLHGSLMGVWAAVCILSAKRAVWRRWAATGLVLALALDGFLLARQYLKPHPVSFIQENALVDFLEEHLGTQRVAVLQMDGIYSFYLTHLFPPHHIAFSDAAVAPRLDRDTAAYFEALGSNRIRIWQEFGVKYVLASRPMAEQMFMQNPGLREVLTEAWSFTLGQRAPGQLEIRPGSPNLPGQSVVLELKLPSNRFMLMGNAIPASQQQHLEALEQNELTFSLSRVHDESFEPILSGSSPGRITGILGTRTGFLLQVEVDSPRAFLRLADRYDPALRARINGGESVPLLKTDVLFAGLELPAGVHEVELFTDLPVAGRVAEGMVLVVMLGIIASFIPKAFRKD